MREWNRAAAAPRYSSSRHGSASGRDPLRRVSLVDDHRRVRRAHGDGDHVAAHLVRAVGSAADLLLRAVLEPRRLYVAFFSGQGFDWPLLSWALPFQQHAWNVPVAVSGAAACMFVREIADLKRFWPRVHATFGWFAVGVSPARGFECAERVRAGWHRCGDRQSDVRRRPPCSRSSSHSWRGGKVGEQRASSSIAWVLLETFTIAAALRLLTSDASDEDFLLHTGLPLSMVMAAVLIALGVADRLLAQRRALSEAERRAETDPLTGVLNRRSLVERLEAACQRAQARDSCRSRCSSSTSITSSRSTIRTGISPGMRASRAWSRRFRRSCGSRT